MNKKPFESVDIQLPNSIERSKESVEGDYIGGSLEALEYVIAEAERRGMIKALEKIEYITQRYGVSWSGEARLRLIEYRKINSLEEKKV